MSQTYIEQSLGKDENIEKTFEHHWMVKVSIILHFILSVLTIGLWLPVAIFVWLHWRATEQAVTNRRVIYKHGIISRKTAEMKLSAMESVTIQQGVLGRIFGYGKIIVRGRGAGDVTIKWMKDPMQVKRDIEYAEYSKI